MNNFQNCSSEKFPLKIVAEKIETTGSEQRKGRERSKNRENYDNTRPSEALKIFYESKNFYVDEPHHEWIFSAKKKNYRDLAQKSVADEKKRSRKNWKKTQKREIPPKASHKKSNYIDRIESQIVKAKATGSSSIRTNAEINGNQLLNNLKMTEVREPKRDEVKTIEFGKIRLTSMSSISNEKLDSVVAPKKSLRSSLSPKRTHKVSSKTSTIKTTTSECRKKHINDILKNRDKKIYASTLKTLQAKEGKPQEAPDLAKDAQHILEDNSSIRRKDEKEKQPQKNEVNNENNQEAKREDSQLKVTEKASKETKNFFKDNKIKRGTSEEKKKPSVVWTHSLQADEVEKKLKPGEEPKATAGQNKEGKQEVSSEDEKKIEKTENFLFEDERKSERRSTYTDRLLLLKMVTKNLEEKKQVIEAKERERELCNETKKEQRKETKETKNSRESKEQREKENKDRNENPVATVKKIEPLVRPPSREQKPRSAPTLKNESAPEINQICYSREPRLPDSDPIIKTKPTRSAELRDLVSQAIKDHKIFCIFDNHTYIVRPVREELLSRGWLEVLPDRRLIPRRRPPPMGPTLDRDKTATRIATPERNCNTLEAILTAKENFEKEIQETVSKSPSFKLTVEKPKPSNTMHITPAKKISEESLSEVMSQFRIIPPTADRKKNNIEIREFTAKYQAIIQKEKEREIEIEKLKERENNAKNQKKENNKPSSENAEHKNKRKIPEEHYPLLSTAKSIQKIIETLRDNQEVIMNVATEILHIENKAREKITLGAIYDSKVKSIPAVKEAESEPEQKHEVPVKVTKSSPRFSYTESEAKAISKLIQSTNARIHFMWLSIKPAIHLKCFNYSPDIINKFQKTTFCTKIGLWSHLSNLQWYAHEVHYPAKSPRMYNTGEADDLQAFFQDFQLTACIGMLKWLSDTFFEKGMKAVQAKKGKVPLKAFEFAIKQCEKYIRYKENEDLSAYDEPKLHEDDWNIFLQWFYIITNDHGKIQESSSAQLMVVYTKAMETLKTMRRYWPEIDIDGRLNIWIMKPYCASCGRGIFMTNNVYYIAQHSKYIVQKYIERPLLIYNTKFDIRQWFMITKLTPLEIWMYKECYLRFCTQPFALRNLHESVHLSNNSVQRKYTSFRDPSLPDQNMWDSNTFQLYLKTIGHPHVWGDVIYPGMRDAIVSTMLAAQDTFDGPRKNWFEIYGADFMLSSNLKEGPWLIEINENPAMDPSTKITSRLCPQMLRDVIKVVVDKRANKNANTGQWELIYRQNFSPSYGTVDIDVRGKKIARVPQSVKVSVNLSPNSPSPPTSQIPTRYSMEEVGPSRLYEYVKSFRANRSSEKEKRKAKRSMKISEVEFYSKNSNQFKKCDIQAYVQNYTTAEINFKKTSHKKEVLPACKIYEKSIGPFKDSTDSITNKNDTERYEFDYKDSILVKPDGMKYAQNTTPTKKTQRQSNRASNLTENVMTFYSQFIADENKNNSGVQMEKYKFTKHYKI